MKFFNDWCKQVNRSNLEPEKKVSRMQGGLRTFATLRVRVLFFLGKLDRSIV